MNVLRAEDLDAGLAELVDVAKRFGKKAERAAVESGDMARRIVDKPDVTESKLQRLRDLLEDEVVVSKEAAGTTVISPREEHREIAKRALAHLKLSQLKKIAADLDLAKGGSLDDVAERIVIAYKADQEEIARLVIEYEEEPPPERRLTVRIYPIQKAVDQIEGIAALLGRLSRRYIRTGIARWFVFDTVDTIGRSVRLDGTFRHYTADAEQDDDVYRLHADRRFDNARLWVTAKSPFIRVEAKGDGESRAIVTAFTFATGLERVPLSFDAHALEGAAFSWTPKTAFMIELLVSRFRSNAVDIFNLTTAGFERPEAATTVLADDVETTPAVRSVRFQGAHLLASRPACELIVEGQTLMDLSLLARFRPQRDESYLMPVNLKLARDHIAVSVGFGVHAPELARQLRDVIADGIEQAYRDWPQNPAALMKMADAIRHRADSSELVWDADIFGPDSTPADS